MSKSAQDIQDIILMFRMYPGDIRYDKKVQNVPRRYGIYYNVKIVSMRFKI